MATPGRLCEVVFDRRRLKLGSVTTLVLDEVDALLRSPYDREVDAIVEAVPSGVCVCVCVRIYRIEHNRAIRPCHPSHYIPLALILPLITKTYDHTRQVCVCVCLVWGIGVETYFLRNSSKIFLSVVFFLHE